MQKNYKKICVKGDENRRYLLDYKVTYRDAIPVTPVLKGERMSIVNDAMFKTMIVSESRKQYSCKLLSYILNVSYEYLLENLHFYKNTFDKKNNAEKSEVGDFVAVIDESMISIEMNIKNTLSRNAEYTDRLYASEVKVGERKYQYRQVIQINYNNFAFEGHDEVKKIYRVQSDDKEVYIPKIYVEIYLPNLRRKMYNLRSEGLTEEERCILAMFETDCERASELSEGDAILMRFMEEVTEPDYGLFQAYDHKKAELEAEYEKGLEIGEEKQRIETVKRMLAKGYEIEEIRDITSLSKEYIQALKNDLIQE